MRVTSIVTAADVGRDLDASFHGLNPHPPLPLPSSPRLWASMSLYESPEWSRALCLPTDFFLRAIRRSLMPLPGLWEQVDTVHCRLERRLKRCSKREGEDSIVCSIVWKINRWLLIWKYLSKFLGGDWRSESFIWMNSFFNLIKRSENKLNFSLLFHPTSLSTLFPGYVIGVSSSKEGLHGRDSRQDYGLTRCDDSKLRVAAVAAW